MLSECAFSCDSLAVIKKLDWGAGHTHTYTEAQTHIHRGADTHTAGTHTHPAHTHALTAI